MMEPNGAALVASITIRNIPDELYEDLKQLAEANHRSINREVIACIERWVRGGRIDPDLVLARAREIRESIKGRPITDAELTEAKRTGRP
jgi:antitoxin FitA